MAQSVDIEIRVDQSGAVSGLRSFGTEMASTTTKVQQLNVALGDVSAKSARITGKGLAGGVNPAMTGLKQFSIGGGSTAFEGLKKDASEAAASVGQLNFSLGGVSSTLGTIAVEAPALEKIGGHALTSLDNVRLLRDDLGIRLPRSMEKAIASSKALSGIVNGFGTGLLALGAIQIGFSIATQAYDQVTQLWDNWLSVTKAAKDYEDEVRKIQSEDFTNVHSIETAVLRIDQATKGVAAYKALTDSMAHQSWSEVGQGLANPSYLGAALADRVTAHEFSKRAIESQQKLDKFNQEVTPELQHQQILANVTLEHTPGRVLTPEQRVVNETSLRNATDFENSRYSREKEGIHDNPVAPDALDSNLAVQRATNQRKAEGELAEIRRQHSQEQMHLDEQALEAGLRGSALYQAQESASIADLKFKDMDSVAARNAIHLRFHNEEMKRLQDQQLETQKILDDTKLAGLTGIAHVQQEGSNRVDEVKRDRDLDDNPQERAKRVAAIEGQTAQEIGEKQLEWTQRVDEVVEQSQTRQVSGFARIRAEADKASADLQRQFDEAHSNMDVSQPGAQAVYDQDTTKLGVGLTAINQSSDSQQAQLAEKNAQETLQIEQEAQRKSMSALRQQTAAINSEYDQRVSKYREQLRQQEISQEDFDRRVAAAAKDRDAEMVEASRAAREKMAGQFDSLFKSLNHPMQALANLGEKVAGEVAAELVQKMQQRAGVSTADSPAKGGAGILNLFTGLMDGTAFNGKAHASPVPASTGSAPAAADTRSGFWPWSHPRGGNSAITQPAVAPAPGSISSAALPAPRGSYAQIAGAPATSSASSHAFEVVSATIRISSATIILPGVAGSSTGAGSQAPIGGGTTLLGSNAFSRPSVESSASSPRASLTRTITQAGESDRASGSTGAGTSSARSTPRFRIFGDTRSVDERSWDDEAPVALPGASSDITTPARGRTPRSPDDSSGIVSSPNISRTPSSPDGRPAPAERQYVNGPASYPGRPKLPMPWRKSSSGNAALQLTGTAVAPSNSFETSSPGASISALAGPTAGTPNTAIAPSNAGETSAPGASIASISRPPASSRPSTGSGATQSPDAPSLPVQSSPLIGSLREAPPTMSTQGSPAQVGGAGSSSAAKPGSFAGTTNDYPQKTSMFGTVMGDIQEGMSFTKQAGNIVAGGAPGGAGPPGASGTGGAPDANPGGSISAAGSSGDSIQTIPTGTDETIDYQTPTDGSSAPTGQFTPSGDSSNGGMLGGGGIGGNLGGAISGGIGMYSAVEGDGGVGGALKGALAGEQLGMALGGPIGAAIGAVGGAIVGAIGIGGREKARVYDLKTVRPKITGDMDSYHQGSMDYTSVYSDFQATDWQARLATGKMGPAAHDYYNDTIAKEIKQAEAKVTAEQKAGRSMYTTSAAQFDIGTDYVPRTGMAVIHEGERITPSDQNERITQAIENQNSPESMRANYVSAMQARDARSNVSGGDRSLTMNIHAMDSRSVAQFFDQHKHTMRATLNDARSENSGGGVA